MAKVRKSRQDAVATRARIISVAEKLFAEKGFENVTVAEITEKSGQKNRSAVLYHFGSKDKILQEIMQKHLQRIHVDRSLLLDEMEDKESFEPRDIAEAIVLPLANCLNNPDGGLDYIRITPQLIGNKDFPHLYKEDLEKHLYTKRMWKYAIEAGRGSLPRSVQMSRTILILSVLFHGLANFAAILANGKEPVDISEELFVFELVDTVERLLTLPPSEQTQAVIDKQPA